jgi:Tol biopolymer transport system component
MKLHAGTRLGPYEVLAPIGAGGMGEVYRAKDTRLHREVALKVLPDALAADPQRMARFEREAQVLASLNHPNVATLYGLDESGPAPALVMELVEGATLADLAAAGRGLPAQDSLTIAKQVAEALEYAHDRGIVHRDLKPANIKITPEGTAKVLDFGLARALQTDGDPADPSNSPTMTAALTDAGFIVGTAAYMAPEQARGKPVDRRADNWAFGCVLYEMFSGRKAFQGETSTDVLAAVITKEPEWSALPATTPPAILRLLRRCLQKDPRQRLQAIGEARIAIEGALGGTGSALGIGPPEDDQAPRVAGRSGGTGRSFRRALPWVVAGLLGAALVGVVAIRGVSAPAVVSFPVLSYLPPPPDTTFRNFGFAAGPVAVSPDGRQLVFSATDQSGVTRLYVRPLGADKAEPVAGTDDASSPFWSPDGRSLGFIAGQKLKTVNLGDGSVQVLADASNTTCGSGGSWSPDGVILFAPHGCRGPLEKISAAGGEPGRVTSLEQSESGHASPAFLPDGRHFLYAAESTGAPPVIWMGSINSPRRRLVLKDAVAPQYAAGFLFFIRNRDRVFAQPMDHETGELSGEPTALADAQQYSVAGGGVLAFQGGSRNGRVGWFDRNGNLLGVVGPVAVYSSVRVSADGSRVLAEVGDAQFDSTDLWSYPAAGGVATRLTFGPGAKEFAVWSPDGKEIAYACPAEDGRSGICRKPADGSGLEERLITLDSGITNVVVVDWSPDGRYLSFNCKVTAEARTALWILPLVGERKPFKATPVATDVYDGRFSPDGRWLAYFSYESGRPEAYVVPFPGPGGKFQISQNGGWNVQWDRKGHLYFWSLANRLMQADLAESGASLRVTAVHPLFQVSLPSFAAPFFDVSADGGRFLVVTSADPAASQSIGVLLNWASRLNGRN